MACCAKKSQENAEIGEVEGDVEEREAINKDENVVELDMASLHDDELEQPIKQLNFCQTLASIPSITYLLILTLVFVGSGQLAIVGMAGNLLTKKYHISATNAGSIMGRYQIITGITKPFVVLFTYFVGSRGWILLVSGLISTASIFIMAESGTGDVDLVKAMMIILPIMTALYYPVYFAAVSLTCTAQGVELAIALSIVAAGLGQTIIPSVMGALSNSQTAIAYENAYLFLGFYVLVGALISIPILVMDLGGNKKLQSREEVREELREESFMAPDEDINKNISLDPTDNARDSIFPVGNRDSIMPSINNKNSVDVNKGSILS